MKSKQERLQLYTQLLAIYKEAYKQEQSSNIALKQWEYHQTRTGLCLLIYENFGIYILSGDGYDTNHPDHMANIFPEMWALAKEKGLTEKMFWFPSGDRLARILFLEELVNTMLKETDQNNEETEPTPFKPF